MWLPVVLGQTATAILKRFQACPHLEGGNGLAIRGRRVPVGNGVIVDDMVTVDIIADIVAIPDFRHHGSFAATTTTEDC